MQLIMLSVSTLFLLGDLYFLKYNKNKFAQVSKIEYIVSFIIITCLLASYMKMTGILDSAYHLIDDHEILRKNASIELRGILRATTEWMKTDLKIRLRPTFWIVSFFQCFVCGTSMHKWHLFQLFLVILCFYTSYVYIRMKRCLFGASVAFLFIIFWGQQSPVIWKLELQECSGILFVMLTLICLHNYSNKRTILNFCFLLLTTALVGGIKESFLLLIPLLPCILIMEEIKDENYIDIKILWEKIKKEKLYILFVSLFFVISMCIIKFKVGLLQIGYAGIDESFKLKDYVEKIGSICKNVLWVYIKLLWIPIIIWGVYVWNSRGGDKAKNYEKNFSMLVVLLMFSLGLGCQLVLYAKSGMYERYLIPTTLIIALFLFGGLYCYFSRTNAKYLTAYYLFIILLLCNVIMGNKPDSMARAYAQEGKDTTALLDMIAEYREEDPNVIVSLGGAEREISVAIYLHHKWAMRHVYNIAYSASPEGFATDDYGETEAVRIPINVGDMYIFYSDKTLGMMDEYKMDIDDYIINNYGAFDLCIRNDN